MLNIDVSPTNGNLIKEMELYVEYHKSHPAKQLPDEPFVEELYDNYGNCSTS